MPRNLDDVLDYFLPPAQEEESTRPNPAALPLLTVPLAPDDAVRAGLAWNLGVEWARRGARSVLVAPRDRALAPLWPEAGPGPLGCQVHYAPAHDASALAHAAIDLAVEQAAVASDGGLVLVALPREWLQHETLPRPLLRWLLLWSTPDLPDLRQNYALAKRAWLQGNDARIGLVVHGARDASDARSAFARIAGTARRHLSRSPVSYGLVVDDLQVYRATAEGRPIGLLHPQSRAARAVGDVAGMLWQDALKMNLG
ncbi:MAG: hypothetical protein AAF430_19750 [Myxococcota bacterium]